MRDMNTNTPPTVSPDVRRASRVVLAWTAFIVAAGLLATSLVMVDETELVIVERLGNIVAVYDRPRDRGLHVKWPWPLETVRRFDRRVQLFDPPGRELFTRDKKNITADAYICWQIAETPDESAAPLAERPVVRFFRSLGSIDVAEQRLDSRVRSILSAELGQVELGQLFSVSDSEQGPAANEPGRLERISDAMHRQMRQRPDEAEPLAARWGLDVVDARIQRINLPEGNRPAVYERMRSERRKIADQYRSAGLAENRVIRSQADRQASAVLAKAKADAERIRGEGEAEAIRVLNQAHALDPELSRVLQTLDAYRKVLGTKTTLVLSASSNLFKLLTDGVPPLSAPPSPPVSPTAPGERVSGSPVPRAEGMP